MLFRWLPLFIALVALLGGCGGSGSRDTTVDSAAIARQAELRADSLRWARADSLLATLSPRQRLGMLLMPAVYTRSDDATMAALTAYALDDHVGGIILLKGDTLSAIAVADTLRRLGREDMLIAIDAEWGLGMRLADAATYPVNSELGLTATGASMREYGREVGRQARRLGIDMVLGPVVDVVPDSISSFLKRRSLGGDAGRVGELACSYAEGVESEGVISVAKHFPGHGGIVSDSHRTLPVLYKSLHELEGSDLLPFRMYVARGLSAIMIGHVAVPPNDTEQRSAALSESVMTDLLRDDMKFKGLILTDAMNMAGAGGASASEAIAAGADLVLAPVSTAAALADLEQALAAGRLTQQDIDSRVRRILYYSLRKQKR